MKITKQHKRDFVAYLRFAREWPKDGCRPISPTSISSIIRNSRHNRERGDISAILAFVRAETHGSIGGITKHPLLLATVFDGKALLNLSIKQWASGVSDAMLMGLGWAVDSVRSLKRDMPWLPSWVWRAVWNQAISKTRKVDINALALMALRRTRGWAR